MASLDIKSVIRALKDQGWTVEVLDSTRQRATHPSGSIVFISGRQLERRALMNTIGDLRRTGHFTWPPERREKEEALSTPDGNPIEARPTNPIEALVEDVRREIKLQAVAVPYPVPPLPARKAVAVAATPPPPPYDDPIDKALLLFREARDFYVLTQEEAAACLTEKHAAYAEYDRVLAEIERVRTAAHTRYEKARADEEAAAAAARARKEQLDKVLMVGIPDARKSADVVSVTDVRADRSAGVRRG